MDRGYRKVSGVSCSRSLFERLLLSMRDEKKPPPPFIKKRNLGDTLSVHTT